MASILEPIRDKMIEHLEALGTIHHAMIDYTAKETQFPFAVLSLGAGGFETDINKTIDREVTAFIAVHGHTRDAVDEALEDIMTLWYGSTNFTALYDLGVIMIDPADSDIPMEFSRDTKVTMGYIQFDMLVRYNYV